MTGQTVLPHESFQRPTERTYPEIEVRREQLDVRDRYVYNEYGKRGSGRTGGKK